MQWKINIIRICCSCDCQNSSVREIAISNDAASLPCPMKPAVGDLLGGREGLGESLS